MNLLEFTYSKTPNEHFDFMEEQLEIIMDKIIKQVGTNDFVENNIIVIAPRLRKDLAQWLLERNRKYIMTKDKIYSIDVFGDETFTLVINDNPISKRMAGKGIVLKSIWMRIYKKIPRKRYIWVEIND